MIKRNTIIPSIIGIILILTTIITYLGHFTYLYELTFLSNFGAGIFFIIVAIMNYKNKNIPQIIYLCFTILLLMVFLICIAFITEFNFSGGLLFLHVINPLIVLLYFAYICNMKDVKKVSVLSVLIMPLIYLIFAIIYGNMTENYIYFFLDYKSKGIAFSVAFIFVVALCIVLISYGIYFLNILLHREHKIK